MLKRPLLPSLFDSPESLWKSAIHASDIAIIDWISRLLTDEGNSIGTSGIFAEREVIRQAEGVRPSTISNKNMVDMPASIKILIWKICGMDIRLRFHNFYCRQQPRRVSTEVQGLELFINTLIRASSFTTWLWQKYPYQSSPRPIPSFNDICCI